MLLSMQKSALLLFSIFFSSIISSQSLTTKLSSAFQTFEKDAQLKSGIASLYVVNAKTGAVVYKKNEMIGLAPASTQKIITSASAYELLGKDFYYKTKFGVVRGKDGYQLSIQPSGDPTLGSWRWESTKEVNAMNRIVAAVRKTGAEKLGPVIVYNKGWEGENIPNGWIWEDIGNYYGAGAEALNWRENQYDLILKSGANIVDPVEIVGTKPFLYGYSLSSQLESAAKGTGDNAYIYFPLNGGSGSVRGTIPVNEKNFIISGALPDAHNQFIETLRDSLKASGNKPGGQNALFLNNGDIENVIHTETSPPLDSIIYWFNKKSINLYGEALVKTIGFQKNGKGNTKKGVDLIKDFWKGKGIAETELNMVDGSGLSPLNRVTTHAQVHVLQHAKKQSWYNGFYYALPEYNGMKMKSGTIQGAKGFCGYHKSKSGEEYIFSFLVNNYNGSASGLVQKMYKVLDVLK